MQPSLTTTIYYLKPIMKNNLNFVLLPKAPVSIRPPVHQSLASLAPTYLTTDIHLVSKYCRRPLHSSTDRTLTVPWTYNRFGDRSFAVAGPRLWNSLPISLRQISSFSFGDILKIIYLGFEKSQRSVTHDFLRYINILTYLLTYSLSILKICHEMQTIGRLY